jgi:hypothetical protein
MPGLYIDHLPVLLLRFHFLLPYLGTLDIDAITALHDVSVALPRAIAKT